MGWRKIANGYSKIICFTFLIFSLILSLCLHWGKFATVTGAKNLEATYHVLQTIRSLKDNPAASHWFLPIVTPGAPEDKFIPWGATVANKITGDYIYTSFSPAGFVAPYLVFNIFNLDYSGRNLAIFNFLLGSITAMVLFVLLARWLEALGSGAPVAAVGALVGTSTAVFSREVLQSHGLVYWSHGLSQLLLAFALLTYFQYLTFTGSAQRRRSGGWLSLLVFLFAWTEWTGYVFGLGLAALAWWERSSDDTARWLARKLVLALLLAGAVTVLHYSFVLGLSETISAFIHRFSARSANRGSMGDLLQGYALSYGAFILIILCVLAVERVRQPDPPIDKLQRRLFFLMLGAAVIPLVENFVMLQHASEFSFDRLKFVFPAAAILAVSYAWSSRKGRLIIGVVTLVACGQNFSAYNKNLKQYEEWTQIDLDNKKLVAAVETRVDKKCTVFLTNLPVRAYSNLLVGRSIFERTPSEMATELMYAHNACAAVYLYGKIPFTDLSQFTTARITQRDGRVTEITGESLGITSGAR